MNLHRYGTLVVALAFLSATAHAQNLERHPYPQNMQPDSVEILWKTDVATQSWIEVTESQSGARAIYYVNAPTTSHQIRVPNLKPNTSYQYQVGYANGKYLTKLPSSFQTFPNDERTSFSFFVCGDHRSNPDRHRAVVDAMLVCARQRGMPRFFIDTGDYTSAGDAHSDKWDQQFFVPEQGLIENLCVFPAIGNHELSARIPFMKRTVNRYLENFSVPTASSGTENYYSFDFSNAHFCVIDACATDFTTGSQQYEWIKTDLAGSAKPWKFAVLHYPPYVERIAPNVTHGNKETRQCLVPLFERYGVNAVLCGDSHFYQRSEVNGIQYICTGGGGAPLYTPGNDAPYVRASKKTNHYAWVTIEGKKMNLEVFDTSNALIDSTTLTNPRAAKPGIADMSTSSSRSSSRGQRKR